VRRESSTTSPLFELIHSLMGWVLILSALLIILITGYYVYGTITANSLLFRAKLPDGGPFLRPDQFQQHVANMQLLTQVLLLCAGGLIVSAFIRHWKATETGLLLLVVGAGLSFGMQYLVQAQGGPPNGLPDRLEKQFGDPRLLLTGRFFLAGMALMAAGALQLLVSLAILLAGAARRRPVANAEAAKTAQQVRKANDQFLGPCWKLPFCRDTDKQMCPIRQSKKPCWRTGRGCYCDQQIVLTLSGGNAYAASQGGLGYQSRAAALARPKTRAEKRAACLGCPVYLHHQGQKYKVLTPLAIITAIGLVGYYWSTMIQAYPKVMVSLGRSFSGFSLATDNPSAPGWATAHPEWIPVVGNPVGVPEWAANLANTPGIMWMLVVMVAVLATAYLLQGVEWALYQLGI